MSVIVKFCRALSFVLLSSFGPVASASGAHLARLVTVGELQKPLGAEIFRILGANPNLSYRIFFVGSFRLRLGLGDLL
jgi:hypothetical protein